MVISHATAPIFTILRAKDRDTEKPASGERKQAYIDAHALQLNNYILIDTLFWP